jgi:pyruvate/2-oxoglutarate dehydrogenase complex dihydrolipoamide dehydrogenase (E3) component
VSASQRLTFEGQGFDHVVVATGITPRVPDIKGIDHPMVVGYIDAIMGRKPIRQKGRSGRGRAVLASM